MVKLALADADCGKARQHSKSGRHPSAPARLPGGFGKDCSDQAQRDVPVFLSTWVLADLGQASPSSTTIPGVRAGLPASGKARSKPSTVDASAWLKQ